MPHLGEVFFNHYRKLKEKSFLPLRKFCGYADISLAIPKRRQTTALASTYSNTTCILKIELLIANETL